MSRFSFSRTDINVPLSDVRANIGLVITDGCFSSLASEVFERRVNLLVCRARSLHELLNR